MRQRAHILQTLIAAGLLATTISCGAGGGNSLPTKVTEISSPVSASAAPAVTAAAASAAPSKTVKSPAPADDALDPNIMTRVTEKPVEVKKAVPSPLPIHPVASFKPIKPEDLDPANLPMPFAPDTVDRSDANVDITHAGPINALQTKTIGGGKDVPIDIFLQNPQAANRARFWGINTANDLLMAGRSPFRRWVLKFKLGGLFYPTYFGAYVLYWVEQADLLRVPGVTPQYAFMLQMTGISSVPDLARWAFLDQLAIYTNMGQVALTYGLYMPSFTDFKSWVESARTLAPIIY